MRCSCQVCGTYMTQSEGLELGCVCPQCLNRCKACLGTDSVISREAFRRMKDDPTPIAQLFADPEPDYDEHFNPDEYGRE